MSNLPTFTLHYSHFVQSRNKNTKQHLVRLSTLCWRSSTPPFETHFPSSAHRDVMHLAFFARAAIISTLCGSSSCGNLLRVQMLHGGPVLTSHQTWVQCTVGLQWSSWGLFRWGVHNGEVSLTEGWINVAWRREFPPHFPPWLPHHIQLLNSLLCAINLFLPPWHHRCITVYALHIKPKVSLEFEAGSLLRQQCTVRIQATCFMLIFKQVSVL